MKLNKIVKNWCKLIVAEEQNYINQYNSLHRESAALLSDVYGKFEEIENKDLFQYELHSYEVASKISEIFDNINYIYRIFINFLESFPNENDLIDNILIKFEINKALKENKDPYLISRSLEILTNIHRNFNNSIWHTEDEYPEIIEKIAEILELLADLFRLFSRSIDTSKILEMSQHLKDIHKNFLEKEREEYLENLTEEELEEMEIDPGYPLN